jgi:hypothetical protein
MPWRTEERLFWRIAPMILRRPAFYCWGTQNLERPFQRKPTNASWRAGHGTHLSAPLAQRFSNASQEAIVRNIIVLLLNDGWSAVSARRPRMRTRLPNETLALTEFDGKELDRAPRTTIWPSEWNRFIRIYGIVSVIWLDATLSTPLAPTDFTS